MMAARGLLLANVLQVTVAAPCIRFGSPDAGPVADNNILPWDWSQDQWLDYTEDIAQFAASKIPVIGGLVSFALGVVWPHGSSGPSLFDQMYKQIEFLVDQEIIQNNQDTLNGHLANIQDSMTYYNNSNSNEQRGQWLVEALNDCDLTWRLILSWETPEQYIPWMVQLSGLHLQMLREQYLFGKDIYGKDNPSWKTDLENQYNAYLSYFPGNYSKWKSWRWSQITGSTSRRRRGASTFSASDKVSGVSMTICYKYEGDSCTLDYKPPYSMDSYANGTVTVMQREVAVQMISSVRPTFYLWRYIPWLVNQTGPDGPPIVPSYAAGSFTLGPYMSWGKRIVGINENMEVLDKPGIACGSKISVWNSVDSFQVDYLGHSGTHVGDSGGAHYSFNFDKYTGNAGSSLQAIWASFWYYSAAPILGHIKLYLNPNKSLDNGNTTILVNPPHGGGGEGTINMTMGPWFQVTRVGQVGGPGPSNTDGTIAILAEFMYNYTALQTYDTTSPCPIN